MASTREYFDWVLEQFSETPDVRWRAMMGEYLLYCRGKVIGGVYDNRLLVKDLPAAAALLPGAKREEPYPGGKPMLLVEDAENRALLCALAEALSAAQGGGRRG